MLDKISSTLGLPHPHVKTTEHSVHIKELEFASLYLRQGHQEAQSCGAFLFPDGCIITGSLHWNGLGRRKAFKLVSIPPGNCLASPSRLVVDVCVRDHGIAKPVGLRYSPWQSVSATFHIEANQSFVEVGDTCATSA